MRPNIPRTAPDRAVIRRPKFIRRQVWRQGLPGGTLAHPAADDGTERPAAPCPVVVVPNTVALPSTRHAHLRLVPRDAHMGEMEHLVDAINAQMDAPLEPQPFTPTRELPCPVMRPRGVYVADVLQGGVALVYSVDSKHNVVQRSLWYPGHALETIQRDLWHVLNETDPQG